jgi:choline dehydrogenase-like flavoprotein
MNVAVIGSGVAGVFAARALASRGLHVTILDVGETLDPARQAAVEQLRDRPPGSWPAEYQDLISSNATMSGGELPKKMHFGSDYIYAADRPFAHIVTNRAGRAPYPTFARGGFSNIWGAAALPPDACDMADWPVSRSAMDPYFRKVAALLPLCGGGGSMAATFPAYNEALAQLDPGPQGIALLKDLARAEKRLAADDILYGPARLAIHTAAEEGGVLPCNGCGQCFTGCVRGSIFSTVPMLDGMVRRGEVVYRGGLFVRSVREDADQAHVRVLDLKRGPAELTFKAVFLAAGPLNTTAILLRSADLYDRPVVLKESQKFVLPALRIRAARTAAEQPSITLAAAFIEARIPELSNHWMHVQMIPMNDMVVTAARLPGLQSRFMRPFWAPILRRVMLAWCGMHSDHSSSLELTLRQGADESDTLSISLNVSEKARAEARVAARRLARVSRKAGIHFQPRMIRFSNPGSGTHCGSSFPMRSQPADKLDSDSLGRPFGWRRIHAIDASVLPSIPGTTLAFPVMANAVRIAELAPMA